MVFAKKSRKERNWAVILLSGTELRVRVFLKIKDSLNAQRYSQTKRETTRVQSTFFN